MGHEWEQDDEATVSATVEEVWDAIATGTGIDSWFMGRSEVEPGPEGSVHTDFGGFAMTSKVTTWDPPHRFGYRGDGPGERFIAYEYLIEGRDQSSTVVRVVANGFLPGDDWEAEFEAMSKGGRMYFATLAAYLDHFAGRRATSVEVTGPPVVDWLSTWVRLRAALGVGADPAVGDVARAVVPGLPPIEGTVDFVNQQALGVRTQDGLYRFIQGYFGSVVLGHHLFGHGVDETHTKRAWQTWVAGISA